MRRIYKRAGFSEDVPARIKKDVLSWFGQVELMSVKRMAKRFMTKSEGQER